MRTLFHSVHLRCAGVCACLCLSVDFDGGSIIGQSPHPAGEQLWDVSSEEDLNLCGIVRLCLGVHVCVCVSLCGSQSGFGLTLVPCPEPTRWQPSFALNSVASA